jgi:type IX secretion system PorP/SprF family membrane protein
MKLTKIYSLVLIIIILITSSAVKAQQELLMNQYIFNGLAINPAVAGSFNGYELRAMHRMQWFTFPGGPVTTTINGSVKYKNNGIGLNLLRDQTGPLIYYSAELNYAYHIRFNESQNFLGLGLSGRLMNIRLEPRRRDIDYSSDVVLTNAMNGKNSGDFNAGAFYHTPTITAGFAARNIAGIKFDFAKDFNRAEVSRFYRHYYLYGSYKYKKLKNIIVEPSLLFKKSENVKPIQYDITLRAHFIEEQLMAGISYRSPQQIAIMAGAKFDRKFYINFAYDFNTYNTLQKYSGGSFELMLGLNLYHNITEDPYYKKENLIDY